MISRKMKKLVASALMAALLALPAFGVSASALDVLDVSPYVYVNDSANVLQKSTIEYIVEMNNDLYSKTGGQIAVATLDFLSGEEMEDYAYKTFNAWGVGSAERNNGVLLMLVPGENKYWVVQGSGIENDLTSGDLSNILTENLEQDYDAGNYDSGVRKTFDALIAWYENYYGVTITPTSAPSTNDVSYGGGSSSGVAVLAGAGIIIAVLILIAIIVFFAFLSMLCRGIGYGRPYGNVFCCGSPFWGCGGPCGPGGFGGPRGPRGGGFGGFGGGGFGGGGSRGGGAGRG